MAGRYAPPPPIAADLHPHLHSCGDLQDSCGMPSPGGTDRLTDEARHHLMPAYGRGHDKHVTDVAVMSDEKQEGQVIQ